jgi:hypothetical protein
MNKLEFHNNTVDINSMWYDSHRSLIENIANELGSEDQIEQLVEKFLGKEIKFKKLRDPNAPKKAKTSYMYFCNDFRKSITEKNPELKMGGISKELGKLWNSYSDEDKSKYAEIAKQDRDRYEEEFEEYNLSNL